jgi:hypothetical protein
MFPVKFCGLWTLIASTNPQYIGSELKIDYNSITFSPIQKVGFVNIKKNIYGSVFLKDNDAKIIWLPTITYDIDTQVLPRISIPYKMNCPRIQIQYEIDETNNWVTVHKQNEQYVFRRDLKIQPATDTILKIFLTQLFFDFVIRHLY